MMHLVKLEFQKYQLHRKWLGVMLAHIILVGMSVVMYYGSAVEQEPFDWEMAIVMTDALVRGTFLVYSSVIMAQLVAEEYRSGTINQLFCYPIERWKLMFAKLLIVFAFTVVNVVIGNVLNVTAVAVLDSVTNVVTGDFSVLMMTRYGIYYLAGLLATAFLSLLPYVVCMRRKSTSSTIVAGVVLTIFLISSAGGSMTQATYFFRSLTLGAVALIIVLFTLVRTVRYIGENDVL